MPMTPAEAKDLEEAKMKAFSLLQTYVGSMRDMIEDPNQAETLRQCGHRTLEAFLVHTVKYVCKEQDKIFKAYERKWP